MGGISRVPGTSARSTSGYRSMRPDGTTFPLGVCACIAPKGLFAQRSPPACRGMWIDCNVPPIPPRNGPRDSGDCGCMELICRMIVRMVAGCGEDIMARDRPQTAVFNRGTLRSTNC
jgi:hypothetical protein